MFPRRPLSRPESHLSVNLSNLPLRRRGEKVIPGDTDPETRGVWKWCHGRDGAPTGARMQTHTNILKKRPPEVQIHGMKQSIFSKGGWNFHFLSHFLRHLNMKRPRYSEGFVSTMSACVCVCVCHTTRRGGWASVEESPGLSCYCTFSPPTPPKRDPHFSLHRQLSALFSFLGGGGERPEELKQAVGGRKNEKEKKSL